MCWPAASGRLSSWLAPALGARSWWLAGRCLPRKPLWAGLPGRAPCRTVGSWEGPVGLHPARNQPEPTGLAEGPVSWVLHPSTRAAVSRDYVAHLSSDLGSSYAAPWLFPLLGKNSLWLLRERFAFLFLTQFPHRLPPPSFSCLQLHFSLDCIWPCDAGCLPALCDRPGGDLSPVWVLCHSREIWGAAEQRDSSGPLVTAFLKCHT